jgi:hypothetical protein
MGPVAEAKYGVTDYVRRLQLPQLLVEASFWLSANQISCEGNFHLAAPLKSFIDDL